MSSWYDQQKITTNMLLEVEMRKKDDEVEMTPGFRGSQFDEEWN